MTEPIVSVVMPVYNGSQYLREAIDSILNQTFKDFELIIVNDGSTDNSEDIILSYKDPRLCYIKNEKNSGICITLNKGLDYAHGKYIARMDCDDISLPERFKKQVDYLERHQNIGAIGTDIITFGEGLDERYFDFVHDQYGCKAGLLFATCFAHPTVMLRTSIINEHKLRYDDAYRGLEDFELWYRLSKYSDIANLPEALVKYRLHKSQVTQNVTKQVSDMEKKFLRDRFLYYGTFTDKELIAAENYAFNRWDSFDDNQIRILMHVFVQIIERCEEISNKKFKRAMQITLSKAIVYVCNMCSEISISRLSLYSKALTMGLMPFDWCCKFMFHEIIRI